MGLRKVIYVAQECVESNMPREVHRGMNDEAALRVVAFGGAVVYVLTSLGLADIDMKQRDAAVDSPPVGNLIPRGKRSAIRFTFQLVLDGQFTTGDGLDTAEV